MDSCAGVCVSGWEEWSGEVLASAVNGGLCRKMLPLPLGKGSGSFFICQL